MSGNGSTDRLFFNGVNGSTGEYLLEPMPASSIAAIAKGEPLDKQQLSELKFWNNRRSMRSLSPLAGTDPRKLEDTGWAVIFAHDASPRLRESVEELLDWRKEQASKKNETFYREFSGGDGYRPGESKREFLARHGTGPGPADPKKVPYYLLIIGNPDKIPFRFQYQLDVQYAVGRLWFDGPDKYAQYAQYARSVVTAETGNVRLPRKAVFFGVKNRDDPATNMSATELVAPLAVEMPDLLDITQPAWGIDQVIDADANKQRLAKLLGGEETPTLLFSASHGMGFNNGDPKQLRHQGAILCQDWPGPIEWRKPIPQDHYFCADDVSDDANLLGLITFHFACYGAGTPKMDDFAHQAMQNPVEIAPHAFVANLPQRLLGHPKGGALAVIGHVERAWGYSFMWNRAGRQLQSFQSTLKQLMDGYPVGAALEYFNERYAELSTDLSMMLEDVKFDIDVDDMDLAGMWTANNDARSYVILGDPAVRMPLKKDQQDEARPVLERVVVDSDHPVVRPPPGDDVSPAPNGDEEDEEDADGGETSAFASQLSETEKRFAARQQASVDSFDAPPTGPQVLRRNDPKRIRQRLTHLGLPFNAVDQLVKSGIAFGNIPSMDHVPDSEDVLLERVLGKNDFVDAHFLAAGARAARPIGRIRIRSSSGQNLGFGTGSLIGPRLLLTNNHVLKNQRLAASSIVEFRVEDRPVGAEVKPAKFRLIPADFFLTHRPLDFTLVAVAETNDDGESLAEFGFNAPYLVDDPILVEEYVNIIQHPGGRPKQVALRDNQVTDLLDDFLHYRADTEPGSSGSPVFNDQWEIVALHHSGVPRRDANDNLLARDGSIWQPAMGDQFIDWIANEGVRLSGILNFVSSASINGDSANQLRDTLLETASKERTVTMSKPTRSRSKGEGSESTNSTTVSTTLVQNGVQISVPLNITVSLGALDSATGVTTDVGQPQPVTPPPKSKGTSDASAAVSIDPDYDNREGYDPEFLGRGSLSVPLPKLSAEQRADAAQLIDIPPGANRHELKYHHYSVVMNGNRRLALLTAVNIDGKKTRSVRRERDKWFYDSRISKDQQVGNELYKRNPFDRGHLVRRLDPAWGRTLKIAKVANDDTFHWTNCSPQHERFNQGKNLWQGVENYLLERADDQDQRLTVFTGPVFRDDDPLYRDIKVPTEFWKVAVLANDGKLASVAFVVTQEELMKPVVEEGAIDVARTYQVPVSHIEEITGLDFGELRNFDIDRVESFAPGETHRRELNEIEDIQLPMTKNRGTGDSVSFETGSADAESTSLMEPVVGTDLKYYLLAYDSENRERTGHTPVKISDQILSELSTEPVTDVFLFSHGWMGDVPAAREQYQGWIGTMAKCESDIERMNLARPGFRPLLVGLHWPSLPFGDENLGGSSFGAPGGAADSAIDELVEQYAQRLGDNEEIRKNLRLILDVASSGAEPDELPDDLAEAYIAIDAAMDLPKGGAAGAPGRDRESFDPKGVYREFRNDAAAEAMSFGLFSRDTLLAPLRTLSFWRMKDFARSFGEEAVNPFLRKMQEATTGRNIRYHLVGHSFGCIAASAAIAGPVGGRPLPHAVDSLCLLQGALSLWAYCSRIPKLSDNTPGYFNRIMSLGGVRGPIVTSQSRFDTAVGKWYPRAAWTAGQVSFAPGQLPKYGAIGTFGIQGPGIRINDIRMETVNANYGFRRGQVYNVDGSQYINTGGGISGAHSDIRKPEIGHMVWSAVIPQ